MHGCSIGEAELIRFAQATNDDEVEHLGVIFENKAESEELNSVTRGMRCCTLIEETCYDPGHCKTSVSRPDYEDPPD